MEFLSINNFNFNSVNDFECERPEGCDFRVFSHKREDDKIIFEANFVACPCIYYVRQDDLFCFSFDVDKVVEFAQQHNIPLTDTYDNLKDISDNIRSHIKSSIMKRYKYNVNYIEKWKKVILKSDGTFETEENTFIPFQLEIKDNYDLFKKWIIKYKKIIDNLIDIDMFVPTITGGLDTRAFTGLYRHRVSDLKYYYLKSIKADGKNNLNKGLKEVEIAEKLCKKINLNADRVENLEFNNVNHVTLSGMFNENTNSYDDPNDPDWIYKFLQHSWGLYRNVLLPFMDDDWLIFKQDTENFELQRVLFILLFAPDTLFLPFISGSALFARYPQGNYIMKDLWRNLKCAVEILNYWGKEKVDNILKED